MKFSSCLCTCVLAGCVLAGPWSALAQTGGPFTHPASRSSIGIGLHAATEAAWQRAVQAREAGAQALRARAEQISAGGVAMSLVDETGLGAFDAGCLADSWRQQPGAPAYCTDLSYSEMGDALGAAEKNRLPKRRDLAVAVMQERLDDGTTNPDEDWGVRLARVINI